MLVICFPYAHIYSEFIIVILRKFIERAPVWVHMPNGRVQEQSCKSASNAACCWHAHGRQETRLQDNYIPAAHQGSLISMATSKLALIKHDWKAMKNGSKQELSNQVMQIPPDKQKG